MFGVTGAGLNKIKNMQSGGKKHRWSVDQWDKVGRTPTSLYREPVPLSTLLTYVQQSKTTFGFRHVQRDEKC